MQIPPGRKRDSRIPKRPIRSMFCKEFVKLFHKLGQQCQKHLVGLRRLIYLETREKQGDDDGTCSQLIHHFCWRKRRNEHLPSFIFCLFVEKYFYYYYPAGNLFLLLRAFVSWLLRSPPPPPLPSYSPLAQCVTWSLVNGLANGLLLSSQSALLYSSRC